MTVPPVAGTSLYATNPTRDPVQQLDGKVFLQLLVAQLRSQDPSSPMDTNEMIGQTTQLAMMEQLTALTTQNQEAFSLQMRMAASNLIGHTVTYKDSAGEVASGTVSSVSYAAAVPVVMVGDDAVRLDAITGISPTTAS